MSLSRETIPIIEQYNTSFGISHKTRKYPVIEKELLNDCRLVKKVVLGMAGDNRQNIAVGVVFEILKSHVEGKKMNNI